MRRDSISTQVERSRSTRIMKIQATISNRLCQNRNTVGSVRETVN